MQRHSSLVLLVAIGTILCTHGAHASVTYTGTPIGSWAYFLLPAPQIGENSEYFPTSTSEYAGAQFQGFVADSPWGNMFERAEFHIFTTYATSSTTQQLSLLLNGDDGHSLFVNNAYVGGGGFNVEVDYTLNMQAGVPVKLEVAGFNGPGDWVFGFAQTDGPTLSQTPGVTLDATNVIPEPSCCVALVAFGSLTRRRIGTKEYFPARS